MKGRRLGGENRERQHTIGYGQPPVLLLDVELVADTARVWVLRIIHLCVLVGW